MSKMRVSSSAALAFALTLCAGFGVTGCNRSDSGSNPDGSTSELGQDVNSAEAGDSTGDSRLPLAALSGDDGEDPSMEELPLPEQGTPEWLLYEINTLRRQLLPETTDRKELEAARNERTRKVADLATEAIEKTYRDPAKEEVFNQAVHQLMEARLQLALTDPEAVDDLDRDAELLYQQAPKSKASAEAKFALARFAHTNAQRFGEQQPRWFVEFATQAQTFASSFPHEPARSVTLLSSAALSCEMHGLFDEAAACYTLLQEKFPDTPQAQQATAVLRRLALKGQPVQLAGPTLDGKFVSIDDYNGRLVVVLFWSSSTKDFLSHAAKLTAIVQKHEKDGVALIGVNLDEDEAAVHAALEQSGLKGPQIFFPKPEERQWENPIVKYYGVRNIPLLWLIDRDGTVADFAVDVEQLDGRIESLLGAR